MRDKFSTYFIQLGPPRHCEAYIATDFLDPYQTRLSSMAARMIHLAYSDELAYLLFTSPFTVKMR